MSVQLEQPQFQVGLSIGSSQTRMVVGSASIENNDMLSGFSNHGGYAFADEDSHSYGHHSNRSFHIFAAAQCPHNGIRRGTIVDLESITASIREAVDDLERQTGFDISAVRLSFASVHALSENFTESLALKTTEVKASDSERLFQLAKSQPQIWL